MNPWKLFKTSEINLATEIVAKISEILKKFSSIDLNSISDADKQSLLVLSDNMVPYEWRKLWQGPKLATEFLKSVSVRVQHVSKFADALDDPITEIDFAKIFNVDSFLSTVKLVTSRDLKVSTSHLTLESFTDAQMRHHIKFDQSVVVNVAPLLIDGLSFDKNRLVQADGSNVNSFTSHIFFYFKEIVAGHASEEPNAVEIPLYATHSREKLLCTFKLNTSLERDEIIYSGTSLIVPAN